MKTIYIMNITIMIIIIIIVIVSTQKQRQIENFEEKVKIPHIIWTYWHTQELPESITKCIETWKVHNPEWEIRILNDENLSQYLPDVDFSQIKFIDSHARKADVIRVLIIAKYGGVWCDASIIMYNSLNTLPLEEYEFVGYYLEKFTSNSNYPVIESWFFASTPTCKFMKLWKDSFMSINDYENIDKYIEHIITKTDIQNIDALTYLAIHVSSQYVLQNFMTLEEIQQSIYLEKAEDGPYKYLHDNDWDVENAMHNVCSTDRKNILFYKLRGRERPYIDNDLNAYACIFES